MTEQVEDAFWAQERARAVAERGRQADPSACGTCRGNVQAGGQVKHDECAQRATLLPAPDAPGWELITGMSEEELRALPPRFHIPVFMDSCTPTMWVCAVCWGDGWSTQWPCPTAYEQGTKVFTPEHQAETVAKKQAVELEKARAERNEFCDRVDTLTAVAKGNKRHVNELFTELQKMQKERDELRARVAELQAERKRYVGAEPTIAEEMAYLSRCIDSVLALCDQAEQQATRWERPLPVPEWVASVRAAAEGLVERRTYPPALPWAALMDDEDLADFLADVEQAIAAPGAAPVEALAAVETACGTWRSIAEAQHAHNTADGPDAEGC